jgi:hypothetical protein
MKQPRTCRLCRITYPLTKCHAPLETFRQSIELIDSIDELDSAADSSVSTDKVYATDQSESPSARNLSHDHAKLKPSQKCFQEIIDEHLMMSYVIEEATILRNSSLFE